MRTLEDEAIDATHWSTRDLAAKVGMSPSSVARIWRAFGLKPWLTDSLKLSKDPQFVDKVRHVVALVVIRVDEKTSIQALDLTQPLYEMSAQPGMLRARPTRPGLRRGHACDVGDVTVTDGPTTPTSVCASGAPRSPVRRRRRG